MRINNKLHFLIFLLFTIVLIGCTDGVKNTTSIKQENSEGMDTEDVDTANGDGELHIGYNVQPETLDSHFTSSTATRDVSRNIYESLVTKNSNYEIVPMLAESFERSEDGKQVTFYLRKGVLFHNGEEMTSEDVVASMEKWQKESNNAKSHLAGTEYEAIDTYTVIAHINEPASTDMEIFAETKQVASIMPKSIAENADEGVLEYIGTGPFKLDVWNHDQYIHLTKFEDYQSRSEPSDGLAGKKNPSINDIYFHIVKDSSTRTAGIISGEYDIVNEIPQDSVHMFEGNPGLSINMYEEAFPGIVFNKRARFFSSQTAREAANAAFNVEEMLLAAYGNEQFYNLDPGLMKEELGGWYSNSGIERYNTYDPDLAEELLNKAGYNGEEIVILVSREHEDYYNMAVVAQQQLESIGMNVSLESVDWGTLMELRSDENYYDLFVTNWTFQPNPILHPFWNPNWPGWIDSKEIDQLLKEIKYARSQEEAQQLTAQLQEEFWDYLPFIKLGNPKDIEIVANHINGLERLEGNILWNISLDK